METRAHFVLIGAFTLVVMVAAALFVLWLGKFSDREYALYDVVFEEPVTGLSLGGAVQYNGIQVGEVYDLRLDPQNPARVIARVRVGQETPIKADTRAQLGFMGVTGVALIQLSGGTPSSPILAPRDTQEVGTMIADASNLQRLIEGGGDVFANINDLLLRMNRVFADENIASFSATASHVQLVAASLADERESLEQLLRNGAQAAARLEQVLARADRLTASLEGAVSQVDDTINVHLDNLFADVRGSALELRHFSARLDQLMAQSQPHIERFSRDGLDQLSAAMDGLAQLSRRLEQVARRLEDDPASFIFGNTSAREYEPES